MKLDNLGERLVREVKRNKAKSAVLGVLCLVALYFWVPLVWKWSSGKSSAQNPPADVAANFLAQPAVGVSTATNATTGAQKANTTKATKHSWRDIVDWIGQDHRMTSATQMPHEWSPFRPVEPLKTVNDVEEHQGEGSNNAPAISADKIAVDDLGLELTTTLVGQHYRVAKINGKRYRENQSIVVRLGGKTEPRSEHGSTTSGHEIELTLAEIHPRHVVLAFEEKTFELPLSRAGFAASGRIDSSSHAELQQ